MYDEKFKERLDDLIDNLGGITKACAAAEVSQPTIGRWRSGSSEPLAKNLSMLAKAANVSLDWLVYGVDNNSSSSVNSASDYVQIPFYHAEASAGHGAYLDTDNGNPAHFLSFRQRWLSANQFKACQLVGLIAKGDSMEPTIHAGASIVVNKQANTASDGNIYVIRIADRLWVKRTQWLPDGGLMLISDNKSYQTMSLSKEDMQSNDIEVIGQVVHTAYDLNK